MEDETTHYTDDQLDISVPSVAGKREKVLTEKQKAFLQHLGTDAKGDIKAAMAMAGYAATTKPHDVIANIKEEIVEVATNLLATNSVKAVTKLVGVLDDPTNPGNKNIIGAAKELLDRAGLLKKDANNIRADVVVILPPKDSVDVLPFSR